MIELPIRRLRDDAVLPSQAYAGDAGLDLAACERVELGPGERATVGTGLAIAIPEGYAGFVQPRSGLASRHGITIVNTPGLVDSGYRGELRVVLLNTDARETFVVEPGMRIAQLVVLAVPGVEADRGRRAARERAGRARVRLLGGLMATEPRIRVSALLRWEDRILLCRHEKAGRGEYWLLPGGGVNSGESLVDALHRELAEEVGIVDEIPVEGPVAIVDSISPQRTFTAKHVVHIIFAGDLSGRSLEAVTSNDAAVRGHRLFLREELDGIVVHPPIQRFLRRWQPGDPAAYLGALWAP